MDLENSPFTCIAVFKANLSARAS